MKILSEKQKRILITVINNAQGQGVKFLIQYESGLIKKTPELDKWYNETKEEFIILQNIKDELSFDTNKENK